MEFKKRREWIKGREESGLQKEKSGLQEKESGLQRTAKDFQTKIVSWFLFSIIFYERQGKYNIGKERRTEGARGERKG